MWVPAVGGLLALVLAAQLVQTQGCPADTPAPAPSPAPAPNPAPPPTPSPGPAGEVFTTQDGVRFRVETVAQSLEIPWAMAFAPDDRLFVTERPGRVRILNLTASTSELALTVEDVFAQGEAGLLGLALDPQFAQTRWVYLYYTATISAGRGANRVVRYREVNSRLVERVVLLDNIPAAQIHDGGRLRFGPDGLLYVTAGDAAVTSLAQDMASYAGKILRLERDGSVPRENPFASPIYSSGHRNPQGLDWHPSTGELWASEHGATGNDEIYVIRAGANYGWPRIEGSATSPGMETPITSYSPAIAPSGTSFYRGSRFPAFGGNLFVATLRGSHLLRLRLDGRRIVAEERLLEGRFGRLRDVVSGPDGFLYLCTNTGTDRILRLVPAP
jgi:glucose/arabinose dehydrogenase